MQTVPWQQPKHVSKRSCAYASCHVWCSKKLCGFASKTTTKRTFDDENEIRVHKLVVGEVFGLFRNVLDGENDRLRNDVRCQHFKAEDEERGGCIIVFVFSFFVETPEWESSDDGQNARKSDRGLVSPEGISLDGGYRRRFVLAEMCFYGSDVIVYRVGDF